MFFIWVIGMVIVVGAFFITHEDLHREDWVVIIIIASLTGSVLWHYCHEFYHMFEITQRKKRPHTQ